MQFFLMTRRRSIFFELQVPRPPAQPPDVGDADVSVDGGPADRHTTSETNGV
jgi:hypothetical protein